MREWLKLPGGFCIVPCPKLIVYFKVACGAEGRSCHKKVAKGCLAEPCTLQRLQEGHKHKVRAHARSGWG